MKKIVSIAFLSLLFFSFVGSVSANGLVPCDLTGENRCTFCDIFQLIDNIIDELLLRIIPVLSALMIAIGGGMYIISQGNPEMLARVKKLFTGIVIGLVIIYGAWAIVYLFLSVIGGAAWMGFGEGWWEIKCQ